MIKWRLFFTFFCHKPVHVRLPRRNKSEPNNLAYVCDHCSCWEAVWIEACSEAALKQVYSAISAVFNPLR